MSFSTASFVFCSSTGKYRRMCTELAKRGYPGIELDGEAVARRLGRIDREIA
ncbi:hypothetical protein ACH4ZU_07255 [Streptomyces sp. NPDC020472]|uniref:hypothetical protein n=1 Tax=Streptomyces sp. NPDC020472 TaxID=3365075 RepID=UPI0037B5C761